MRLVLAAVALALLTAADGALPYRQVRVEERGRLLTLTVGLGDLVDPPTAAKLTSGFATTAVLRAYLFAEGGAEPLAIAVRTVRVIYDLWDEDFRVQVRDPLGELNVREPTRAGAVARLTSCQGLALTELGRVRRGARYFVAVVAEINPVSPELLAQVRRWLSRPPGGARVGGADSFFGSFVSVFVNSKLAEAERVVRFRSPTFSWPAPGRPQPVGASR